MKQLFTLFVLFLLCSPIILAQAWYENFDGGEPSFNDTLTITFSNPESNIWQIGKPQKDLFNSSFSLPNALVTDTLVSYPDNNRSSVQISANQNFWGYGLLTINWLQKLDFGDDNDGGLVEFKIGNEWESPFDNPNVYAFYGAEEENIGFFASGEHGFGGRDTIWRHIWLCVETSLFQNDDSLNIRFTAFSDSITSMNDGWMIDDLQIRITYPHTTNQVEHEEYMQVSPNPSSGRVNISTRKRNSFHLIEEMQLLDVNGKHLQSWGKRPISTFIDLSDHPDGIYFLRVKTNIQEEVFKIALQKK